MELHGVFVLDTRTCARVNECSCAATGGCCATVVSLLGECCVGETLGVEPVLDATGACCASGRVDACGVCDGNGLYLDAVRDQHCMTRRDGCTLIKHVL